MAVRRKIECDLCGAAVPEADVIVMRVGTIADRPDGCTRVDVGPECYGNGPDGRSLAALVRFWREVNGDGEPETAAG